MGCEAETMMMRIMGSRAAKMVGVRSTHARVSLRAEINKLHGSRSAEITSKRGGDTHERTSRKGKKGEEEGEEEEGRSKRR